MPEANQQKDKKPVYDSYHIRILMMKNNFYIKLGIEYECVG
jgi:hypothetical protein